MDEIYLIQLLARLGFLCSFIFWLALLVAGIAFLVQKFYYEDDGCHREAEKCGRTVRKLLVVAAVSFLLAFLIPSKGDMYEIIGIGSVIDYVKDSDEAKALPDKAVTALEKWLDDYTEGREGE